MRVSAVDRMVGQIRDLIASQGLAVGDQLPTERELGERFGASRNTVREALRVIKAYGIIDVQPKTGAMLIDRSHDAMQAVFAFQTQISPPSFQDVQEFRRLIEIGLQDSLLRFAGAADFDRLETISAAIAGTKTPAEAAAHDFAFHLALAEVSGNRTLLQTYRMLRPVICHVMTIAYMNTRDYGEVDRGHREIVAALRAKDRTAYAYLMSRHFDQGLRAFATARAAAKHGSDETLDTAFGI